MMHGKTPTKAEKAWMDSICRGGCIVCQRLGLGPTPACPHHIVSGNRRKGHMWTIPLCGPHHQTGEGGAIPRHPYKARFEAEYGTEMELLIATAQRVGAVNHPVFKVAA